METENAADLVSIQAILKEQADKIVDHEKKISGLEQPKPPIDKNRLDERTQDPQPDKSPNGVDGLLDLAKWYPFAKYFAYCAIQQNYRDTTHQKCVFQFSLRRPVFYRVCRYADILLWIVVIGLLIWSAIKILR